MRVSEASGESTPAASPWFGGAQDERDGAARRSIPVRGQVMIGGPAGTNLGGIGELSACFRARLGFLFALPEPLSC